MSPKVRLEAVDFVDSIGLEMTQRSPAEKTMKVAGFVYLESREIYPVANPEMKQMGAVKTVDCLPGLTASLHQ